MPILDQNRSMEITIDSEHQVLLIVIYGMFGAFFEHVVNGYINILDGVTTIIVMLMSCVERGSYVE